MMNEIGVLIMLAVTLGLISCDGQIKVEPVKKETHNSRPALQNRALHLTASKSVKDGVHTVVLREVLPTLKYVYLRVEEDGKDYWLATLKREVTVGKTYVYKDRLLKTNFESKEYHRKFDTIYLVSSLLEASHGRDGVAISENDSNVYRKTIEVSHSQGSVTIEDLVSNSGKYANKRVKVTGKCTKVNAKIMNRNWIHLDDGTNKGFDFVVTTQDYIPVGHVVTMQGRISVHKDFGAGYVFDVIMEDAVILK